MRLVFLKHWKHSAARAGWLLQRQDCYYLLVCSKPVRKSRPGHYKNLSSCLIHNEWMEENGVRLKFTPPERSIVLAMHGGTVREIEVNENTALNR